LGSWNTARVTNFQDMFEGTSVSINTTAYWDTTKTQNRRFNSLSPQQPCPAGYDKSQTFPNGNGAQIGTLADRCPDGCGCPDGCDVASYYEDANGFCRNDCFVDHCEDCTTDRATKCDTCATGFNQNSDNTACECAFGTELAGDGLSCTDCTTKEHSDQYYATQGSCTTVSCTPPAATEYFDTSAVYTTNTCSVATCAKGTKPAADQLSCDSCATVSGSYYTTAGDCSVATCQNGQTPAADGLSCVDGSKGATGNSSNSANSPAGDIVGSIIGVFVLVAVAGVVVWVFLIKPKRDRDTNDGDGEKNTYQFSSTYAKSLWDNGTAFMSKRFSNLKSNLTPKSKSDTELETVQVTHE